jgi:hypoxanthine phosphoribosyltransferase
MIDNDVLKVLITEEELRKRVYELGDQLTKDYSGKDVVVISVLKGSIMFMADLLRAFNNHVEIDFMVVSSYGAGVVSTGAVKMIKDVFLSIEGKDVLIVEDILDTGRTLHYIKEYLQGRKPNSIRICTLLDKPERREADISADYVGFTVPDEFVIGYGLDFNEKYRNLPYIGVLKPSLYE